MRGRKLQVTKCQRCSDELLITRKVTRGVYCEKCAYTIRMEKYASAIQKG
jgi:DNA-directed RNA polymerase subunit RPC12/RpoP